MFTGALRWPCFAVNGSDRLNFDGIAEHRARPMALDGVDGAGLDAGLRESMPNARLLSWSVGRRESVRSTVLVHRAAPDDCEQRITVALSVR
jgi:hypothetical protein